MDWEDDYNTQEDQPSARLDGDTKAMGSPMGTHDLRRSTVAGMVGEEERRRSTTPGTESQRPPQPLGTREAMPVPVPAGAMTSGRSHFGGGSLRSGRDTAPTDGGAYDSWDEDGSGAEASLTVRRAAASSADVAVSLT